MDRKKILETVEGVSVLVQNFTKYSLIYLFREKNAMT